MSTLKIPTLYRLCLKQIWALSRLDPIVSQFYLRTITKIRHDNKLLGKEKQSVNFLASLTWFLNKVNSGEHKHCLKLTRIFCNASQFCDRELNLQTSFESRAIKGLDSDIQFADLSVKDQLFVKKLIKRVCDKKKSLKYKDISSFLTSPNSESAEKKISLSQIDPEIIKHFRGRGDQWQGNNQGKREKNGNKLNQVFEELVMEEQDKMRSVLAELYRKGVVIV